MGVGVNIKLEINKASKVLGVGFKKKVTKAAMRGMNKAMTKTRTEAKREISRLTSIKQKVVLSKLKLKKASPRFLRASVEAFAFSPNVAEFMTEAQLQRGLVRKVRKGGKVPTAAGAGVKARMYGELLTFKGAFVGRGRSSGKLLVFARTGAGRGAELKALRGASVKQTFIESVLNTKLKKGSRRDFITEFNRQVKLLLKNK